jgi:NADPH:quinone reductase-like Zn-dependent oxidoreductase
MTPAAVPQAAERVPAPPAPVQAPGPRGPSAAHTADAWLLYAGEGERPQPATLVRETIQVPEPGPGEVVAEPLYGCWEGNMGHALTRRPVDICRQRREPWVVIGNAGVVRVRQVGEGVTTLRPGQNALIFCTGVEDRWGYPDKILGYDAPGSMGCLSTVMRLRERQLIAIPEGTRHSLAQWAAFSLRYITAWANWELASGVFHLSVGRDECPAPHVWGWGGGVSLAELDLARRHGCRAVMLSGSDHHLASIPDGITAVDRRQFGELDFDEKRDAADAEYRAHYREVEKRFVEAVREHTDGEMVQVFLDYVGAPVYRLTLRALSREGVIATAGWKEGMELRHLRAKECIERHQHVYTHYARYRQGVAAVRYAEENGWMPPVDGRVYAFDEVPLLAEDYEAGRTSYFPTFSINPE